MNNRPDKPKLRDVNVQQITYQGKPVFLLQDSLKLTEAAILLPQPLGPLALLCDGQHTVSEIRAALEVRFGLRLPQNVLEDLLQQFDKALLLESETFSRAKQQAIEKYRTTPFRPPALAGPSYPADPDILRQMLREYLDQANGVPLSPSNSQGIISPHIDYDRGGLTYAQVWASAAEAVRQAELVIIFGTDHNGGLGTITLTTQNYATPLGVMPTDKDLVNRLAGVLGPENAFADELHHRGEHSIELALVWLQYLRNGEPCPILPVLCGSFHHFMTSQARIEDEGKFKVFTDTLREEITRRRTVIVAAGDLAHLGPAFDGFPLDAVSQARMKVDDAALMEVICQGNAGAFLDFMKTEQYKRNVCGLSSFYFMLDILGPSQGQTIAYDRCPADPYHTSFVSICGIVLQPSADRKSEAVTRE
ncbi:MAG: AmmeMemoRadiSam system protein B [Anaerolineae bacterium]|nr:AmmeMemoRadiSam system protein B [Anaerolineae bacterium]